MPKNSRPDIQVLEARVERLKAQLLEYKEIRTYEITKQRLSNVSLELQECISIIGDIVESSKLDKIENLSTIRDQEYVDEFGDDGDLSDLFLPQHQAESESFVSSEGYAPKQIVSEYASRIKICSETPTGIVQVNQFCSLLNSWYQTRFVPEVKNPNFFYKASRIHEWVDLLIIASGDALHTGKFPEFKVYMDSWISELNTSADSGWILPLKVRQITDQPGACTKEAVLIERVVKSILYSESFYPSECSSVAKIVMKNSDFTVDDLKIDNLLESCPKLIPTSSFDVTKYREAS